MKTLDTSRSLNEILKKTFLAIISVDVLNNNACILESADFPDRIGHEFNWDEYLESYLRFTDKTAYTDFSSEGLLKHFQEGKASLSEEISYHRGEETGWMTVEASMEEKDGRLTAAILVKRSSEDRLLRRIIDLYVYSTCDYFIYLNVRENSYVMFSGTDTGTPLPPAVCTDYMTEIVKYADAFVVPEDREKVIYEMGLSRVVEQLDKNEFHSFTCGVMEEGRGYTRKRLRYSYYDKAEQMVLLSRTDITDAYMEAKEKQRELDSAIERAKRDSLTGLLNHQGVIDAAKLLIKENPGAAALMEIDLDNFKQVNDRYGHEAGDELLIRVAKLLRMEMEKDGVAGRIGGDEFLICLAGEANPETVRARAEKICRAVEEISVSFASEVSCSIGVSMTPADGTDYESLFRTADRRAYTAKENGKNQICYSTFNIR